jgi:predicted MFS family arabinose efflux permease
LKELLCKKEYAKTTYLMLIYGIAVNLTYFCVMFNLTEIKGNPIQVLTLFSFAEVIGVVFSERLTQLMKDSRQAALNFILIVILNFLVKYIDLNETLRMVFFFIEILLIGSTFNLWFIIMQNRVKPEFQSVSFELNFSISSVSNTIGPLIAKLPEPTPTIYLSSCGLAGIISLILMPSQNQTTSKEVEEEGGYIEAPRVNKTGIQRR